MFILSDFSICVTSKDRADLFRQSLRSIHDQSLRPRTIAISDASEDKQSMLNVLDEFKSYSSIDIKYEWRHHTKLTRSQGKNLTRLMIDTPVMLSTETDILFPQNAFEVCMSLLDRQKKQWLRLVNKEGSLWQFLLTVRQS